VTKNRRYEAHYDRLNDERIVQTATRLTPLTPITLRQQAYGPPPIHWERGPKPDVWVWMSWQEAPATRISAVAIGWNDRVVCVEWEAVGGPRSVVVWRNAVSKRG
jgi:hypothetical protein